MIFEEEFQDPTLVEEKKNEFVIEEEQLLEKMQVEEQQSRITIKNVLVGINNFNFPINSVTWGMDEDRQVSSIGRPLVATSQV